MSYWSLLWILPIFIGVIFAFSAIYSKEDKSFRIPKRLGYGVCNMDSILSFSILLFLMIFTVVVLQLLAYSSLYDQTENCMPILYFFGSTNGCVKSIAKTATIQSQLYDIQAKMDEIESYKTNVAQRKNYGGIEGFASGVGESMNWFRRMVDEFYRLYFMALHQIVLYSYRLYYDLRGAPGF
jgi:hypothetical protein